MTIFLDIEEEVNPHGRNFGVKVERPKCLVFYVCFLGSQKSARLQKPRKTAASEKHSVTSDRRGRDVQLAVIRKKKKVIRKLIIQKKNVIRKAWTSLSVSSYPSNVVLRACSRALCV